MNSNKTIELIVSNCLAKDIRNAFGLYDDNTALLNGKCADDVSMEIIGVVRGGL